MRAYVTTIVGRAGQGKWTTLAGGDLVHGVSARARFWHRYLPLADETRRGCLFVIGCGFASVPARHPYPPTQHPSDHHFTWRQGRVLDEFQLVYITRGGGWFESRATGRRRVRAGDVISLYPGVWHRDMPAPSIGWDEYRLAFAGREAAELMAEHNFRPQRPLRRPSETRSLVDVYEKILDELRTERHGGGPLLAAWAMEAMARVATEETRRALAGEQIAEAVLRARPLMAERLKHDLDMRELARELHVGHSWFRKKFRETTGFSPPNTIFNCESTAPASFFERPRCPPGRLPRGWA